MAVCLFLLGGCRREEPALWQSRWSSTRDRVWIGPEYWANRLQDWRLNDGRVECLNLYPLRTLHLLTAEVDDSEGVFWGQVRLGFERAVLDTAGPASAGFSLGAGRGLDPRAAALIHHSLGPLAGLFAGVDDQGRLFVRDLETGEVLAESVPDNNFVLFEDVTLRLRTTAADDRSRIRLQAIDPLKGDVWNTLEADVGPADRLTGRLALIAHRSRYDSTGMVWFENWQLGGNKLAQHSDQNCGPVITAQHTLQKGVLRLTAQLMPVGEGDPREVGLEQQTAGSWKRVSTAPIVEPGYTATFELHNWPDSLDVSYRVSYRLPEADTFYYFSGRIRHQPVNKDTFVIAAFTGNHNVVRPNAERWGGIETGRFPWDWGLWFPHAELVENVRRQAPDLLFFSGDQVYEGASPTRPDLQEPTLDYLYKWYLWCWAFRELTADIPTVTIPDDHDVYHGNIWGAGGVSTPDSLQGQPAQDAGGYKLPVEWVNMVHRTQTSHLPPPFDPQPVGDGITNYYTSLTYGGVSLAVLEDRKFKSAPGPLLPEARVVNGWAQNPSFDARRSDVPEARLLGDRQLSFLEQWTGDWSGGAWMKVALSQTIFANLATLPAGSTSDAVVPRLPIPAEGEYPPNDRPVADMDSNGWPRSGRDRAVAALRRGFALHVAGDQHLGSTLQYGIEDWGDSGFAICVPSIANFWARRWFPPQPGADRQPGAPAYTGKFTDGFGNKITVYAVANPMQRGREPAERHDKAAGYGIVRLYRGERKIALENWPIWSNPADGGRPYPGWPVVIDQRDNFGREPKAWLPALTVAGLTDPVVQVIDDRRGEVLYTLRISGQEFQPWVFAPGAYRVRVGEPDRDLWQERQMQSAFKPDRAGKVELDFAQPTGR